MVATIASLMILIAVAFFVGAITMEVGIWFYHRIADTYKARAANQLGA